ncbi:hypothetical protein SAMN05216359_1275 [Roseateles sp. YR242]|nr:hypothetical protein SAMN05216359_1275 [Roseateles sp. YR242]
MNGKKFIRSTALIAALLFHANADAIEVTIENWSKVSLDEFSPPASLPAEKICDWFVEKLNSSEKRISCGRITLASGTAITLDDYSIRTSYQPIIDPPNCDHALPDKVFAANDAMMKTMNDPAARSSRREEIVKIAEVHSDTLKSSLLSEACPNMRRAASILWKYSANCRQQLDLVMPLINDADPVIRNEISQCVGANIGYQNVDRKKAALDAAVAQFQIPSAVDRLKAAWIVEQSLGDPAIREYAQKYRPLFESALKIAKVSNLARSLRIIVDQLQAK